MAAQLYIIVVLVVLLLLYYFWLKRSKRTKTRKSTVSFEPTPKTDELFSKPTEDQLRHRKKNIDDLQGAYPTYAQPKFSELDFDISEAKAPHKEILKLGSRRKLLTTKRVFEDLFTGMSNEVKQMFVEALNLMVSDEIGIEIFKQVTSTTTSTTTEQSSELNTAKKDEEKSSEPNTATEKDFTGIADEEKSSEPNTTKKKDFTGIADEEKSAEINTTKDFTGIADEEKSSEPNTATEKDFTGIADEEKPSEPNTTKDFTGIADEEKSSEPNTTKKKDFTGIADEEKSAEIKTTIIGRTGTDLKIRGTSNLEQEMLKNMFPQIFKDMKDAIYEHDADPFFNQYPIHPYYQQGIVGNTIGILNHFQKGFCNGGVFSSQDIQYLNVRKKSPIIIDNTPNTYIDIQKEFEDIFTQNNIQLTSIKQIHKENGLVENHDQSGSIITDSEGVVKFQSKFNIKVSMKSIQYKEGNYKGAGTFVIEPNFIVEYKVEPSPEYQKELDVYHKQNGVFPVEFLKMQKIYSKVAEDIQIMPQIPLFRPYFMQLATESFLSYYLHTTRCFGMEAHMYFYPTPSKSLDPLEEKILQFLAIHSKRVDFDLLLEQGDTDFWKPNKYSFAEHAKISSNRNNSYDSFTQNFQTMPSMYLPAFNMPILPPTNTSFPAIGPGTGY